MLTRALTAIVALATAMVLAHSFYGLVLAPETPPAADFSSTHSLPHVHLSDSLFTTPSCTDDPHASMPFLAKDNSSSSTDEDDVIPANSAGEFISVVTPSSLLAVVCFVVFIVMRRKKPEIYAPRSSADWVHPSIKRLSPLLPQGWLNWIATVWRLDEEFFINTVGVDATVYMRFMKLGVKLFTMLGVCSLCVLIPVNALGNGGQEGFDSLSLANVPNSSPLMWVHVFFAWAFTAILLVLMRNNYNEIAVMCDKYKARGKWHQYTVEVSAIPSEKANEADVQEYFMQAYPETFYCSRIARDVRQLNEYVTEYIDVSLKLDNAQATFEVTGKRPEHFQVPFAKKALCGNCCSGLCRIFSCLPCVGAAQDEVIVDSIDTYTERRDELRTLIEQERDSELKEAPTAFVTFTKLSSAATAVQVFHSAVGTHWSTRPAPEPYDVYWDNLMLKPDERAGRLSAARGLLIALVIFWTIPVSFVNTLTSLESLSEWVPGLESVVESNPAVKDFLVGFLPTVTLAVLMAILPMIITRVVIFQGERSFSDIQRELLSTYFFFQVFNVFLVTTISGTLFQSLSEIISSPGSIFSILGEALPKQSFFFINYVTLRAFSDFPIEFSRLPVLLGTRAQLLLAKTDLERKAILDPGPVKYGVLYPRHLLIFVIVMSYSVISPLIVLFGLFYFLFGTFVWKHQFAYVYTPKFETAGSHWPLVFRFLYVGAIIFQLTIIGVVALKKGLFQGPCLLPLPWISLYFFNYYNNAYKDIVGGPLSREVAASVDNDPNHDNPRTAGLDKDTYVPLVLTQDLDHLESLVLPAYSYGTEKARREADERGQGYFVEKYKREQVVSVDLRTAHGSTKTGSDDDEAASRFEHPKLKRLHLYLYEPMQIKCQDGGFLLQPPAFWMMYDLYFLGCVFAVQVVHLEHAREIESDADVVAKLDQLGGVERVAFHNIYFIEYLQWWVATRKPKWSVYLGVKPKEHICRGWIQAALHQAGRALSWDFVVAASVHGVVVRPRRKL